MNQRTYSVPAGLLSTLYGVGLVLVGAWLHIVPTALIIMTAAEVYRAYRRGYLSKAGMLQASPLWLAGLASVVYVGLQTNVITQLVLVVLYGLWRWRLLHHTDDGSPLVVAGITQALVLAALFLAAALWHLPGLVVIIVAWGSSWLIATRALGDGDRATPVLVAAWCLLVAEISWLFNLWLVTYIMFNGILLVPQAALVLTALGYCLSGIYFSHRKSQLSRARLIEYLLVGLVLMLMVILGTKWNGVI